MPFAEWSVELHRDGVWTEVAAHVVALSSRRSNRRDGTATRQWESGSVSVTVDNDARQLDPFIDPLVHPGIGVRLSATTPTGKRRVFTGRVETIAVDYVDAGVSSTVTLSGSDALPRFTQRKIPPIPDGDPAAGDGDTTAQRLHRVLDLIEWPAELRDIAAGGVELSGARWGRSAVEEIRSAVEAASGEWWLDRLGRVAFRPLSDRLEAPTVAVFDGTWPSGMGPTSIAPLVDDEHLANVVRYSRAADPDDVFEVVDVDAQARFTDGLEVTLDARGLPHADQGDADDWARLNLLALATPDTMIRSVTFEPDAAELADVLLDLEIGDRVQVRWSPPGGGEPIEQDAWVAGVEHSVSLAGVAWTATLTLASASRFNFVQFGAQLDVTGFAPGLPESFTGGRYVPVDGELVRVGEWQAMADQSLYRLDSLGEFPSPPTGAFAYVGGRGFRFFNGTKWLRPLPPPTPPTLSEAIIALAPAGYWQLDETSGTTAVDSSGNGRNGTYSGTFTLAAQDGHVTMDGAGFVEVASAAALSIGSGGLSVFALVRPSVLDDIRYIASKLRADATHYEWAMMQAIPADSLRSVAWSVGGSNQMGEIAGSIMVTDEWQAVAFTMPTVTLDARYEMFRNSGTPLTTSPLQTAAASATAGDGPVHLGGRPDQTTTRYRGALAHVAIFSSQLTSAQIGVMMDAAEREGYI